MISLTGKGRERECDVCQVVVRRECVFLRNTSALLRLCHADLIFLADATYRIWTQHIDQLPVDLLAQLLEHCTGIVEVMGSNPVRA